MKSIIRIKEWRERSAESLENLLKEFKEKLRSLRFLAAQGKLKNVRELRTIKQDVARLQTILYLKKNEIVSVNSERISIIKQKKV